MSCVVRITKNGRHVTEIPLRRCAFHRGFVSGAVAVMMP
jgi:hypothetical protein